MQTLCTSKDSLCVQRWLLVWSEHGRVFVSLSMIVSSPAGQSAADATDNSEANSTPLGT